MPDTPTMREEIRNGFYPDFERGWRRAELVGRSLMLLVVLATLGGLLGGGPVSLWTTEVRAGALRVTFPPVVRFGTPTGFSIHTGPSAGRSALTVTLPAALVGSYGLQSLYPRPVTMQADADGALLMSFAVLPQAQDTVIEVGGLPAGSGLLALSARLGDDPSVSWSELVLP